MENLIELGKKAKKAAGVLATLQTERKNAALHACADALISSVADIISANEKDMEAARQSGMSEALLDRLMLDEKRIRSMADGLREIAALKDPVGEVISMTNRPNGLMIGKKRVPLGVIGMIYESRPNVTVDAFGLCFKSGNAVILRGGSEAYHSNLALVNLLCAALYGAEITEAVVQMIPSTDRESVQEFLRMDEYVDVMIPRGGAGLIRNVVENSTIPVIQTGVGNCHIFVDRTVDYNMALDIIDNAKTQRLGVCNAAESLVVHSKIAEEFLPMLYERLTKKGIVIRADERAREICPQMEAATEEDFYKEYLDRYISLKIVDHLAEAIAHINKYNSGHSEAIITKNYSHAMQFLNEVDAAAVYVNASTRFTDGREFGLGAEIGISTQKLHARGPIGLEELTTTKYIIFGNGQVRS
ncbi:MAG: glutamate-5-semialdehyde dehydrogenase [Lachnospiraceae bacterium]